MTLPLFNLRLWQQRRTQSRARPTPGSEIIEEKLGDTLHQDAARRWIADAVAAARKGQNLNVLSRLNEIVNHRERVRVMHVVVAGAVSNQQFAFELRGIFHR